MEFTSPLSSDSWQRDDARFSILVEPDSPDFDQVWVDDAEPLSPTGAYRLQGYLPEWTK